MALRVDGGFISPVNPIKICDAGCGPTGQLSNYITHKGHRVIGIDICPKCVDLATTAFPVFDFRTMNMSATSFGNACFDAVIAYHSIFHTPKKYVHKILAEFNRILKPYGKILVVIKKGIDEGFDNNLWFEGQCIHFTHFIESEISDYFAQNHFLIDTLDVRKAYDFEINIDRIYTIGTKVL